MVFSSCARWAALLAVIVVGAGCDSPPSAVQCMSMGASSAIVSGAALVRIELYSPDVACDGSVVATGAPAPLFSRSFNQGDPIQLDVKPGTYTIGLSAWADSSATAQLGAGCVANQKLLPGQQVCIDLAVVEVDASVPPTCSGTDCPCTPQQDDCPVGEYCAAVGQCVPGCKTNADCTLTGGVDGGSGDGGRSDGGTMLSAMPFCDPSRHTCVQCLGNADCPVGDLCSPTGTCLLGCDLSKGKDCPSGSICCNMMCLPSSTVTSCGTACGNVVNCVATLQNAMSVGCSMGACTFACKSGYGNCDGNNANGCETNLNSAATCGSSCMTAINCGSTVKNATAIGCSMGTCTFTCASGYGDCDGNPTNGCETNINTPTSCGTTCINKVNCTSTVMNATNISCGSGVCTFTCSGTMRDCDGNPTNGCETNIANNTSNCGACGRACSTMNVAAAGLACTGGLCTPTSCVSPYMDCNDPAAPLPDDGCEASKNDASHCGSCTNVCSLPNATAACPSGTCTVGTCNVGSMDCDSIAANGCECATGPPNNNQCCGSGCQVKHVNGPSAPALTGQNYFDCNALGTPGTISTASSGYDANGVMAGEARAVFPIAGTDSVGTHCYSFVGSKPPNCLYRTFTDSGGKSHCLTWCWLDDPGGIGNIGGHVFDSTTSNGKCLCPVPTDPTWN